MKFDAFFVLIILSIIIQLWSASLSEPRKDFNIQEVARPAWKKLLDCYKLELMEQYPCLKDVASFHESELHSSNELGPSPLKLGIVTFITFDILAEYALQSLFVNLGYCINNRYGFKIFDNDLFQLFPQLFDNYDFRWNKVKLIEQLVLLDSPEVSSPIREVWGSTDYDYYMWIDADFIFLNMNFKIDTLITEFDRAYFLASAEHSGSSTLINSGSFIVRNSYWSKSFLQHWWNYSDRRLFSDQEQFDLLYASLTQGQLISQLGKNAVDRLVILDANRINTDPPAMTKHTPMNNVLHLMGEESFFRQKIFQIAAETLLMHVQSLHEGKDVNPLPMQLNITRAQLVYQTIILYGREAENLLSAFEERLLESSAADVNGAIPSVPLENSNYYHSYEKCRRLSNIIHHYSHAAEYLHNDENDDIRRLLGLVPSMKTIKELRKKVYYLLQQNYHLLRGSVYNRSYTSDDLEIIKSVVIAGQHLLHDHVTLTPSERLDISEELVTLLQYLILQAHPMQQSSLEMIESSLSVEQALLYIDEGDYESALRAINRAIDQTEQHASQSGNHLLLQPLLVRGNIYALSGDAIETSVDYEKCLTIMRSLSEEEGKQFMDYRVQIFYNYGVSLVGTPKTSRISNFDVGTKYLEKAKELIEDYYSSISVFERSRVMTPEHAEIYERIAKYMEMNDMKVNN